MIDFYEILMTHPMTKMTILKTRIVIRKVLSNNKKRR